MKVQRKPSYSKLFVSTELKLINICKTRHSDKKLPFTTKCQIYIKSNAKGNTNLRVKPDLYLFKQSNL